MEYYSAINSQVAETQKLDASSKQASKRGHSSLILQTTEGSELMESEPEQVDGQEEGWATQSARKHKGAVGIFCSPLWFHGKSNPLKLHLQDINHTPPATELDSPRKSTVGVKLSLSHPALSHLPGGPAPSLVSTMQVGPSTVSERGKVTGSSAPSSKAAGQGTTHSHFHPWRPFYNLGHITFIPRALISIHYTIITGLDCIC